MVNYPASLDNGTTLPNPTTGNNTNNPSHAGLHGSENAAIIATQTKLGTGSSVAAANQLLVGTGAGTSAWQGLTSAQLLAILSDETGTGSVVFANTPTLITPKVDTINENTPGNGTTIGGVNIKSGFMSGANLTAGTVGNSQLATGVCVQVATTSSSAVATTSTLIPFDDTIPQITEGAEFMTLAITPKASTNLLVVEGGLFLSNSAAGIALTVALFQDATTNALMAASSLQPTGTAPLQVPLLHTMTAGTTSSTTFRIRAGGQNAGTVTFNGQSGGRIFGAIPKSWIRITEYKV